MSIIVLLLVVFVPKLLAKSISILLNSITNALKDIIKFTNEMDK